MILKKTHFVTISKRQRGRKVTSAALAMVAQQRPLRRIFTCGGTQVNGTAGTDRGFVRELQWHPGRRRHGRRVPRLRVSGRCALRHTSLGMTLLGMTLSGMILNEAKQKEKRPGRVRAF